MQKLIRKKEYKARAPKETVNIIREILKNNGISIDEQLTNEKSVGVYSCRLTVTNEGLSELNVGTNGKGMTEEYSLASGYAEFMERLQNEWLIDTNRTPRFGVSADPVNECAEDIREFLKSNYGEHEKASKTLLSLFSEFNMTDFCSFDGKDKIRVPIDILLAISGSNGMCAGNNRTEAIIQGTSEIFERYAQTKIIFDKLCPPVIPDDYFIGHNIYNKLQLLKNNNIYYEIKDCSLGIGLPVIGLYLRHEDGREFFHLGSDPSPVTALERTVTEIFQGVDTIDDISFYEPLTEDQDEEFWKYHLELDSWGVSLYPGELGGNNYSWEFGGFDYPESVSDEADMKYYLDIINSLGKKLFIRDVSFLGFPSYFCYIPELNSMRFCTDSGEELVNYFKTRESIKKLVALPALEKRDRKKLAELIISFSNSFWYFWPDISEKLIFPKGLFPFGFSIPNYIKAVLFASCGIKDLAAENMEDYIISNILDQDEEEKLTDFVMYMRTGEYELEETPVRCNWTFGDSIGCQNCEKCYVKSFCCRKAADNLLEKLSR